MDIIIEIWYLKMRNRVYISFMRRRTKSGKERFFIKKQNKV